MLATLREVLAIGKKQGIAVGSFNTPNLESILAVIGAAEALDVPVVLMHAQIHESIAPIEMIGSVMLTMAKRASVKVCVHLDHGEDFDYCKRAVDLGFSSVMIDYSTHPYEENVAMTRKVAYYAHCRGASVEAELGSLPTREGGGQAAVDPTKLYTDPELVPDFLRRTNIDALAIAFGTAHGIYRDKPELNTDIIAKVRARTGIPLVMHGGSGISDEEYRRVIALGINKINYYTYMSYAGYAAAGKLLAERPESFYHELSDTAEKAMYENALRTLKVFAGRA